MLIGLETSKTVAAILESQFGSKERKKTRGESCVCVFQEAEHGLFLVNPSSLVGGACEGIATGFVKRKGASRRTRHVDTKVYFMQARTMEPESCRLAHEDHNCSNGSSQSSSDFDEGVRKIAAHQITAHDLKTFTNTVLINMRMKFVLAQQRSLMMS